MEGVEIFKKPDFVERWDAALGSQALKLNCFVVVVGQPFNYLSDRR
jgi:hypothetical protein